MRIAVSDYDGTIDTDGTTTADAAAAISRWRAAGNVFGIATGRDLPMILAETVRWNIEYDFLICINGAAIYDAGNALLASRLMPDGLPPRLMRHSSGMASMHYQISALDGLRVLAREGSWFPELGVKYRDVTFEEALKVPGLGQLSFAYGSAEECARRHAALIRDFPAEIAAHPNVTTIDINTAGVDKATGIEEILRLKGWENEADRVLTIGDGGNDVEMIRRFRGFTVPESEPTVRSVATRTYSGVPEMLADPRNA